MRADRNSAARSSGQKEHSETEKGQAVSSLRVSVLLLPLLSALLSAEPVDEPADELAVEPGDEPGAEPEVESVWAALLQPAWLPSSPSDPDQPLEEEAALRRPASSDLPVDFAEVAAERAVW